MRTGAKQITMQQNLKKRLGWPSFARKVLKLDLLQGMLMDTEEFQLKL